MLKVVKCLRAVSAFCGIMSEDSDHDENEKSESSIEPEYDTEFTSKNAEFASHLYHTLLEGKEPFNIFISPLYIQIGGFLAFLGAGGNTAKEMVHGLQFHSENHSEVEISFKEILQYLANCTLISMANKFYISSRFELNPDFSELAAKNYNSEMEPVDFSKTNETAQVINSWIQEKTHSEENVILPTDLEKGTNCILLNAIHFKAKWKYSFHKDLTHIDKFYVSERETVEVEFMKQYRVLYCTTLYDGFSLLRVEMVILPFANCDLSMFALLPDTPEDLPKLERKWLGKGTARNMFSSLQDMEVEIYMPRFNIEFFAELKEPFKKMGMKDMFTQQADFANITKNSDGIYLQKFIHKASIEIDEEGDEQGTLDCMKEEDTKLSYKKRIRLNRPFLYLIVDNNYNVIFLGKVVNPKRK